MDYTTSEFYDLVDQTIDSVTNRTLLTGSTIIVENGQQGRKIKVLRIVTAADGSVIHKDTFLSVYPMIPQQIEIGKAKPTTTTVKKTTTTAKPTSTTVKPTTTTTTAATTTTS